jgi:hypothetical chaperone protein
MPTAIFFDAETSQVSFGRHAIRHYVEGTEGRLMRALKSVLGSSIANEATVVHGRSMKYSDVIATFLAHVRAVAEDDADAELAHVVIGRPVFFVDDDPERDRAAQATLESCAHAVGFTDVRFEFEPIAAALDYETTLAREEITLVIDIGGGTSDFSVVRLGPALAGKRSRQDDVLGNLGVHIGGTDFDQILSMAAVMPLLGYRSPTPKGMEVPSTIYFDLATWHRINALQSSRAVHEAKGLVSYYADPSLHARLVRALYFTGGSTGLPNLRERVCAAFPRSKPVFGDPFASVAKGLGVRAGIVFG